MRSVWLVSLSLSLMVVSAVSSDRVVQARNGAVVRVSSTEPNLVEAGTGRVSAFVFSEGAFTETIDSEAGVVYFRPLVQGPLSGFVETMDESGVRTRFSLIVVPDDGMTSQRIVLESALPQVERHDQVEILADAEPYITRIKGMVRDLATGDGSRLAFEQADILDLDGLLLTKIARLKRGDLVGELLSLENSGDRTSLIDESMLRTDPGVIAVSVRATSLEPGQKAQAYLVRRTGSTNGATGE